MPRSAGSSSASGWTSSTTCCSCARPTTSGSGLPADAGRVSALRRRIAEQLEAKVALDRTQLAVDGHEVMRELGIGPGPQLGRILEALTDRVIADPA